MNREDVLAVLGGCFHGEPRHAVVPACPVSGSIYVPKALAEGKKAETELLLEDK